MEKNYLIGKIEHYGDKTRKKVEFFAKDIELDEDIYRLNSLNDLINHIIFFENHYSWRGENIVYNNLEKMEIRSNRYRNEEYCTIRKGLDKSELLRFVKGLYDK